jgi:F-type H+-transporting ATPase subunit gamma
MRNLESLKRNIRSAQDLESVVRTMKTMAAVSIRQYERAVESLGRYSHTIESGLGMLLQNGYQQEEGRSVAASRTGFIVFGTDQGMCGQFNQQIATFAFDNLERNAGEEEPVAVSDVQTIPAICIGRRVHDALRRHGIPIAKTLRVPGTANAIVSVVQELLPVIEEWRAAHGVSRIMIFHNRRVSASVWKPRAVQLLPLRLDRLAQRPAGLPEESSRTLPWWSMETRLLFSRLVHQFLFVTLFRATAESLAGENASRIAAMQVAERNIGDRLQTLKSDFARERQTAITEELLDVVTGFEALQSGTKHKRVKRSSGP